MPLRWSDMAAPRLYGAAVEVMEGGEYLLRLLDYRCAWSSVTVDAAVDRVLVIGLGIHAHRVGRSLVLIAGHSAAGTTWRSSGADGAIRADAHKSGRGFFDRRATIYPIHHEAGVGRGTVAVGVIAIFGDTATGELRIIRPALRLRGVFPDAVVVAQIGTEGRLRIGEGAIAKIIDYAGGGEGVLGAGIVRIGLVVARWIVVQLHTQILSGTLLIIGSILPGSSNGITAHGEDPVRTRADIGRRVDRGGAAIHQISVLWTRNKSHLIEKAAHAVVGQRKSQASGAAALAVGAHSRGWAVIRIREVETVVKEIEHGGDTAGRNFKAGRAGSRQLPWRIEGELDCLKTGMVEVKRNLANVIPGQRIDAEFGGDEYHRSIGSGGWSCHPVSDAKIGGFRAGNRGVVTNGLNIRAVICLCHPVGRMAPQNCRTGFVDYA